MTMIESTNLEISNTQNEAVHPIRSGVLNALISGLKLILISTDCSDHSRISIKYGNRLASRILIVEDEAIVAESLKDQLINLGYQVCGTAANGEDAMRIMDHSEPDLVMMDIMLEGPMDGVEVAGRIREKTRFR